MTIQGAIRSLDTNVSFLNSSLFINGTRLVCLATTQEGLRAISFLSFHNPMVDVAISLMIKKAGDINKYLGGLWVGKLCKSFESEINVLHFPSVFILLPIVTKKYIVLWNQYYYRDFPNETFSIFAQRVLCSDIIPCTYELLCELAFLPQLKYVRDMKVVRVLLIFHYVLNAALKIAAKWSILREQMPINNPPNEADNLNPAELNSSCHQEKFKLIKRIDGFLATLRVPNMNVEEGQQLIQDIRNFLNTNNFCDKWGQKVRQNIEEYSGLLTVRVFGRTNELMARINALSESLTTEINILNTKGNDLSAAVQQLQPLVQQMVDLRGRILDGELHNNAIQGVLVDRDQQIRNVNQNLVSLKSALLLLVAGLNSGFLDRDENRTGPKIAQHILDATNPIRPAIDAIPPATGGLQAPAALVVGPAPGPAAALQVLGAVLQRIDGPAALAFPENIRDIQDKLKQSLETLRQEIYADCYSYWDIFLAISHLGELFPAFQGASMKSSVIHNALLISKLSQKCLQDLRKINF